ncbi:MAG TPA: hypothetical protein VMF61_04880 [Candidatus Acidoferrales bacterium]|nr:hypothetical protein [Candidatus Acidoferrales bacterium]
MGAGAAGAYPLPPTPPPTASPSPSPAPSGNVFPFDSNLTFVIDDPISSKSASPGQVVRAHLENALVVGGRTVAPAGAPEIIKIVDSSKADIGDVYGFVDIFFEPLRLPDGRVLPVRAPVARLAPRVSAGHESTVEWEDTIEDQVIPYHFLYHIFRKGKNFVLRPGSELPAHTEATLTELPNGTVAIQTPMPPPQDTSMPKSSFPVEPVATPFGPNGGSPIHGRRATGLPSPTPTASPPPASPAPAPTSSPT